MSKRKHRTEAHILGTTVRTCVLTLGGGRAAASYTTCAELQKALESRWVSIRRPYALQDNSTNWDERFSSVRKLIRYVLKKRSVRVTHGTAVSAWSTLRKNKLVTCGSGAVLVVPISAFESIEGLLSAEFVQEAAAPAEKVDCPIGMPPGTNMDVPLPTIGPDAPRLVAENAAAVTELDMIALTQELEQEAHVVHVLRTTLQDLADMLNWTNEKCAHVAHQMLVRAGLDRYVLKR